MNCYARSELFYPKKNVLFYSDEDDITDESISLLTAGEFWVGSERTDFLAASSKEGMLSSSSGRSLRRSVVVFFKLFLSDLYSDVFGLRSSLLTDLRFSMLSLN